MKIMNVIPSYLKPKICVFQDFFEGGIIKMIEADSVVFLFLFF